VRHHFTGFGFGPIQAALFAKLAAESGNFDSISVAEVDGALVRAIRANGDRYAVNVAYEDGVKTEHVEGVRLLDTNDPADLAQLKTSLSRATEIVTSLPSVEFYKGVAPLITENISDNPCVVYTAENNNHAAEILQRLVGTCSRDARAPKQFLNTVIGKMSQVVTDPDEIARRGLATMTPDFPRAFLVESFNRILVSQITLPGFEPGITAFEEKPDLLPFEEAKLYGHNAIHAAMGFMCAEAGLVAMSGLCHDAERYGIVRRAFVEEAGVALVRKHAHTGDPLFTSRGMTAYAEDLLRRMTNPHLGDTAARAIRDPLRKLAHNDRVFGAIRLCLAHGVEPRNLVLAAKSALRTLGFASGFDGALKHLWGDACPGGERAALARLLENGVL